MPPRYRQGQLASPVTGTPGLDKSAGMAERQIAQNADAMAKGDAALAMGQLNQAEQTFNQARGQFFYMNQQQIAEQRRQEALKRQEQEEDRKLQVQMDRLDEDKLLESRVAQVKQKFQDEPERAAEEFKKLIPQLEGEFQTRHNGDRKALRMLMPSQRQAQIGALGEIESWAEKTRKANLEKRLNLLPEKMSQSIAELSGTFDDQLFGYQKALAGTNAVYDQLRDTALKQGRKADHDEIFKRQFQINNGTTREFFDHVMAQIPEGEAGLDAIEKIKGYVQFSRQYGLPIDAKDQRTVMEHLTALKGTHEQEVIVGIKGDNDIKVIDANRIKTQLYQAANSPRDMQRIAMKVEKRLDDLDKQIAVVEKEPESKIRNAKLAGLKQEQNVFISEMGLDLKLGRTFDQIQRTLTTFAQGQLRFQQSQLLFSQGQNRLLEGLADKKATEERVQAVEGFNRDWIKLRTDLLRAGATNAGTKQREEISATVGAAMPRLNQAFAAGIVSPGDYERYLNILTDSLEKAGLKDTVKPWIGPEQTKTLKGKQKEQALDQSTKQFNQIAARNQADLVMQTDALNQLNTLTMNKAERVYLTQFISARLPATLKDENFRKQSPERQKAIIAQRVQKAVAMYRKGELK